MIFGLFTDLHYSVKQNDETRFFRNSLKKLERCIRFFQEQRVDFMICLGDLMDCGGDEAVQKELLSQIQTIILNSGIPFYLCLGNHDVSACAYEDIVDCFMNGKQKGYYSFDKEMVRFIVLDTNYDECGKHYTAQTIKWDCLYIDDEQMRWLEKEIQMAKGTVVIVTHGNLDGRMSDGKLDPHIVLNYQKVQEIIENSKKVKLVLQGHYHNGFLTQHNGVEYFTLKALVDGEKDTPVLVISSDGEDKLQLTTYNLKE